ncbi:glycoside hydrolase, partial [Streptomyces sp. SID2131]|nr:glycoside hydrolase [Streptomyces sp. SID2131]
MDPKVPDAPTPTTPPKDTEPDDAAALAPPGGTSVTGLLTRLRTLYRQAEEATERHNAAEEALKLRTADAKGLAARLTTARAALDRERAEAGRIAREQYQGRSELSSYLDVLFAPDPRAAMDRERLAAREGRDRAGAVSRLERAARRADALAG